MFVTVEYLSFSNSEQWAQEGSKPKLELMCGRKPHHTTGFLELDRVDWKMFLQAGEMSTVLIIWDIWPRPHSSLTSANTGGRPATPRLQFPHLNNGEDKRIHLMHLLSRFNCLLYIIQAYRKPLIHGSFYRFSFFSIQQNVCAAAHTVSEAPTPL